jgi:hypothetical protein
LRADKEAKDIVRICGRVRGPLMSGFVGQDRPPSVNKSFGEVNHMTTTVPWRLQADYMETCNCDFGCPCNFNGLPTGGRCETLVAFHLRSGRYGEVPLDGVELVYAASWPRAIHEGDGTLCVYVSDKASPEQRQAITEIVYGRADGTGPFAVFAATFRYVLDPQFVPIEMTVAGKKSHFSVPDILEASLTPHTDPVSGEEQESKLFFPGALSGRPPKPRRRR